MQARFAPLLAGFSNWVSHHWPLLPLCGCRAAAIWSFNIAALLAARIYEGFRFSSIRSAGLGIHNRVPMRTSLHLSRLPPLPAPMSLNLSSHPP